MNATLGRPLIAKELGQATKSMAKEKTLGIDGISIEFYRHFWTLIRDKFIEMINVALAQGSLAPSMTQGLLTFIFKVGERADLEN
jgi:hypothetical protein